MSVRAGCAPGASSWHSGPGSRADRSLISTPVTRSPRLRPPPPPRADGATGAEVPPPEKNFFQKYWYCESRRNAPVGALLDAMHRTDTHPACLFHCPACRHSPHPRPPRPSFRRSCRDGRCGRGQRRTEDSVSVRARWTIPASLRAVQRMYALVEDGSILQLLHSRVVDCARQEERACEQAVTPSIKQPQASPVVREQALWV